VIAYLDTSALLRLVFRQGGGLEELRTCDLLVASELLVVESLRTVDRLRVTNGLSIDEAAARRARAVQDAGSLLMPAAARGRRSTASHAQRRQRVGHSAPGRLRARHRQQRVDGAQAVREATVERLAEPEARAAQLVPDGGGREGDMLFGTYENPPLFTSTCGFEDDKEQRLGAMLAFRDVDA
jgi:hypothetical protein